MTVKVLVTCGQMQDSLAQVIENFEFRNFNFSCPQISGQGLNQDELRTLILDHDYLICGDDEVTQGALIGSRLAGVIKWGIGTDSIDVDLLSKIGIRFSNTPGMFSEDVAEQALALLFATERGVCEIDREVRAGGWLRRRGRRITGRRALVMGYGSIGKTLSKKLTNLGITTSVLDPNLPPNIPANIQAFNRVPDSTYDYLFATLPLDKSTRKVVNLDFMRKVIPKGILINVSRGGIVDEAHLIELLENEEILGAGLDVFEDEPLSSENKLLNQKNVVLGSHNASNTEEGVLEASMEAGRILEGWTVDAKST